MEIVALPSMYHFCGTCWKFFNAFNLSIFSGITKGIIVLCNRMISQVSFWKLKTFEITGFFLNEKANIHTSVTVLM